jgi:hypothetical protein
MKTILTTALIIGAWILFTSDLKQSPATPELCIEIYCEVEPGTVIIYEYPLKANDTIELSQKLPYSYKLSLIAKSE